MFEGRNDARQYYSFFSKSDASGEIHQDHICDSHRKVIPMFKVASFITCFWWCSSDCEREFDQNDLGVLFI